jgi:hypothetical protein
MVPDSASAVKAVACRVARADTSDGGERGEPMATIPARSKFHGAILSAWVRFGCAILKTWPPLPKLIGGVRKRPYGSEAGGNIVSMGAVWMRHSENLATTRKIGRGRSRRRLCRT